MNKTTKVLGLTLTLGLAIVIGGFVFHASNAGATSNNECAEYCYPPTTGECTVDVSKAQVGEIVTFTGIGKGGNGYFTYEWSGTDGLQSYNRVVKVRYWDPGTKTATVKITSNNQSVTKTCKVVIEEEEEECDNDCPCDEECYPPTTGYCEVDMSKAKIGEIVTYTAVGQGGNGYFTYEWSGTDGLESYNRVVKARYWDPGTKTATVKITSNNYSVTKTCKVVIEEEEPTDDLDGYCVGKPSKAEEGDKITWTAYPEGGDGHYEYDWSGTDGLEGDDKSISKRYTKDGKKDAKVKITSGGQTITEDCDVKIKEDDDDKDDDDLEAVCVPSKETIAIGETVTFRVNVSGGRNYEYDWSGTDGLRGDDRTVTKSYSTSGTKTAKVEVTSEDKDGDDDEVDDTCRITVKENLPAFEYTPPTNTGIYLDTIPATGISPNVKTALFMSSIVLWSAFLGWMLVLKRNLKLKEQAMIEEAMNS